MFTRGIYRKINQFMYPQIIPARVVAAFFDVERRSKRTAGHRMELEAIKSKYWLTSVGNTLKFQSGPIVYFKL